MVKHDSGELRSHPHHMRASGGWLSISPWNESSVSEVYEINRLSCLVRSRKSVPGGKIISAVRGGRIDPKPPSPSLSYQGLRGRTCTKPNLKPNTLNTQPKGSGLGLGLGLGVRASHPRLHGQGYGPGYTPSMNAQTCV